jgi:hypothetical protein
MIKSGNNELRSETRSDPRVDRPRDDGSAAAAEGENADSIVTRIWLEEHDWLYTLLRSENNVSPTFRFPDLISACIALVFADANPGGRIFRFLGAELIIRPPTMPRRRESFWRQQFELLLDLQHSPANRHPNPMYQLDQMVTACVALARRLDGAEARVLQQARLNVVQRMTQQPTPRPDPAAGSK